MSFLTDLFHGNTGNLGHDLNPSNAFSDAGKDFSKQPTWAKGLEIGVPALLATLATGGLDLPALLGGLGGAGADLGAGAADAGALALTEDVGGSALALDPAQAAITSALGSGAGESGVLGQALGAPAEAAAAGGGGIFDTITGAASAHPLLTLAGLGIGGQVAGPAIQQALGLNKVAGSKPLTQLAQQEAAQAANQTAYGNSLEQPLITGQLPAGAQQSVTNALNDAITTIKSKYAGLGLSGSTMEADAIANAKNQSTALTFSIAEQMAATGQQAISSATTAMGLQDQIYSSIMNATIAQDQQLSGAIGKFASSIGQGYGQQLGKQMAAG